MRRWVNLSDVIFGVICRRFGNAPNRVRPVETTREYPWRQTEREVSASIALAVMFVVPTCFIVLCGSQEESKREGVKRWVKEHISGEGSEEGMKLYTREH